VFRLEGFEVLLLLLCGMTNKGTGNGWSLWVERFERCGWVEDVGVLRFAQDDSKNRQRQPQIPPLLCGMTNKRTGNRNSNNSNDNGNGNEMATATKMTGAES
jgi:hypothetical protein